MSTNKDYLIKSILMSKEREGLKNNGKIIKKLLSH
jgi:hypothetical protein